ncbi:large conductance mechanosensitive channel protein MscL [Nonlabens marinus]|uniref:Large-conductance mechanosensitive channel n=1 Tax=Nonlabens marinus S1-08 TaxID=1454201 RepID=W8VZL6_9FLAO|nr:large conductance mechanosensitive channel protein MscL [Nonlabens marinus]BAO54791.1 large-conductance mechanosensitive channel [Nonlabens marinus S1-08]
MLKEFKKFILTGNVIDLAVAVILAGAVSLVVKGFVTDIMMPIVGYFTGGSDFSDFFITLDGGEYETLQAAKEAGGSVIAWGNWVNSIINLIIVGFVLFMIVKAYNKTKKKKEEAPAAPAGPSKEEQLLMEIRDAIKSQK